MNPPTPIELLQDAGPIGRILSQLSKTVLDEAETQTEPWAWLAAWVKKNPDERWHVGTVKLRDAAASFHKTFLAAASQRTALLALSKIGRGGGSLSRNNLVEEMLAADKQGETEKAEHLTDRYLRSVFQTARGRRWLLDDQEKGLSLPPEQHEYARQKYDEFYAADLVRLGRKKADEKWKSEKPLRPKLTNSNGYLIAETMTLNWLSAEDEGIPGYCFISDKILATILHLKLSLKNLRPNSDDADNEGGRKLIEDCRRDIGLQKAETLVAGLMEIDSGNWALLDEVGKEIGQFNEAELIPPIPPNLAG